MKIVSAAEMRAIDGATSERFGVPSLTLMENAGSAIARFILSDYARAQRIAMVCGKGNNGGDGFVVARKLAEAGRAVRVLLLCAPDEQRGDAAAMFQQFPVRPLVVREPDRLDSADATEMFAADLLVDAVLGTGFRPPVSPLYAAAIRKMNESAVPVVAVDIPSGADADAMQPQSGTIARANAVVTFTAPRPAHVFSRLTNGPTVIAPIGSPPEAIVSSLGLHLSTPADFAPLLTPRARCQQRQLWPRPGHRRFRRQSGRSRDGRILCAASGRRTVDRGHAQVRARDGCRLPSRSDDRAAAGDAVWNHRLAEQASGTTR